MHAARPMYTASAGALAELAERPTNDHVLGGMSRRLEALRETRRLAQE
jgi:hypothetical protein